MVCSTARLLDLLIICLNKVFNWNNCWPAPWGCNVQMVCTISLHCTTLSSPFHYLTLPMHVWSACVAIFPSPFHYLALPFHYITTLRWRNRIMASPMQVWSACFAVFPSPFHYVSFHYLTTLRWPNKQVWADGFAASQSLLHYITFGWTVVQWFRRAKMTNGNTFKKIFFSMQST